MKKNKGRIASNKKIPTHHKITKLLIANRGEIALRIKRACEKQGIKAVGVCSEADQDQSFSRAFEESVLLEGQKASDTYLSIEKLIAAAKSKECDAIHPGYGFLSENAEFAKAVVDAGLVWIGPDSKVIEMLGSKTNARALAKKCRVPIVPGTKGALSNEELTREAKKMKFPILIKATAGGGGRGMRIVKDLQSLPAELARTRAEAQKFFSNPDVFIERYIEKPRHVEVQLFGDSFGNVIHFGTRDCSAQRRYQKIIEEAPAPFLSSSLRRRIEKAAVTIAKSAKYKNAGTAEFIVKGDEFFFLEINTRIQVEHPVTEIAYSVDLVDLQLKVANGEKIPKAFLKKAPSAYAVECRIYAESLPGFIPSLGDIKELFLPKQKNVRIDFGFKEGDSVSPYYDAMIGKIIFTGKNRLETLDMAVSYLSLVKISGIETNISFLQSLMKHKGFRDGTLSIQTIDSLVERFEETFPKVLVETYDLQEISLEKIVQTTKGTYTITTKKIGEFYLSNAAKGNEKKRSFVTKSRNASTAITAVLDAIGYKEVGNSE
jgi:acetyl/propionyl-CoA carboxylase alpha subunit